jgi:hypothetical protein
MGLSSSKTKTTSNTTQNTNQQETGTTQPITPQWLSDAAHEYVGRIGAFGDMDPNSFVAPASPLQQMAWQNAGSLGDWRQQAATASGMAQQAGASGANLAGLQAQDIPDSSGGWMPSQQTQKTNGIVRAGREIMEGAAPAGTGGQMQRPAGAFGGASSQGPAYAYQAPNVANVAQATAYEASRTNLGAAPQAGASSYNAPTLNAPGLVSGQGYSAPQLGQAGGYAAARTGNPIGAETRSYNAAGMTAASTAPTQDAFAFDATPSSLLDNFSSYQNPYTQDVVNASLADFDQQAAQSRARLEAQGAAAGAFGGSRFGIAQGQLMGDQDRARGALGAGLRQQGFNTAATLSQSDAANRQQASLFNAQNRTNVSGANAAAENSRALAQAGFLQQAGLANQQAQNEAGALGANAWNAAQLQYSDAANRSAMDYAGRQDQASQYGLGLQQQRDLAQAGYANDASRYGADSAMQAALANQNMLGQFGLAQGQLDANARQYNASNAQQSGLANQAMAGQYGLAQFGADTQNAQNFAQARNASSLAGYQGRVSNAQLQAQLAAQAGQYNAGANNQMSQFNAQQRDAALLRQLQAAGMIGSLANDYGSGTRADLATMAQLGDQQRAIEQAYAMAGPAQLQLLGQLSGMTPYDILVGRQVNGSTTGTMTGTGTQTTTQSPSLFNTLLAGGQAAAGFLP